MFNQLQNETYNSVGLNMELLGESVHNMNMSMARGYKAKKTTFHETLNGVKQVTMTDFKSGVPVKTYRELDFAISGEGFFEVVMPDGTVAYTRNGALTVGPDGTLQTPFGYQITTTASNNESTDPTGQNFNIGLSRSPIKIPPGVKVNLNEKGELQDPSGNTLGKINLVTFTNLQGMRDIGEGLYLPTRAAGDLNDVQVGNMNGETKLIQGHLEASNADSVMAMSQILQLNSQIKAEMKIFKTLDQMHGDLNSTISRNL
ncbi:MAG: flagellar hook basal-body protein [Candidatus Caenarcaniphilales bacterium]|nr:flagellar hook basal-body protein [Candidatus Caenarcaniphilales bacterium]